MRDLDQDKNALDDEDGEKFLESLGFKDPFHKKLLEN